MLVTTQPNSFYDPLTSSKAKFNKHCTQSHGQGAIPRYTFFGWEILPSHEEVKSLMSNCPLSGGFEFSERLLLRSHRGHNERGNSSPHLCPQGRSGSAPCWVLHTVALQGCALSTPPPPPSRDAGQTPEYLGVQPPALSSGKPRLLSNQGSFSLANCHFPSTQTMAATVTIGNSPNPAYGLAHSVGPDPNASNVCGGVGVGECVL